MAEFIERAVAVVALNKALFAYEDETEARFKNDPELDISEWFFHRIFVQNMNGIDRQTILDIPAADVRPVVRGRWVRARGSYCTPGGDPVWECSECGKGTHVYGIEHGTYGADVSDGQWVACPNCGADMREEN